MILDESTRFFWKQIFSKKICSFSVSEEARSAPFLCRKITVRFKLNLKTDGLACKIIFKIGGQVERLHSTRKQCRCIYICLFCSAKYLLGTPKPVNCIRWMQAWRLQMRKFMALTHCQPLVNNFFQSKKKIAMN